MAENDTDAILDVLKEFDTGRLILAFCLSMVVGLLIGSLIYAVMTWMSRRRATASITRRPHRQSRQPRSSAHGLLHSRSSAFSRSSGGGVGGFDRRSNNSLTGAALSFHRQASLDLADPPGRKNSFRASTFHPLLQCSQIAREAEEGGGQSTLPRGSPPPPTAGGPSGNATANANAAVATSTPSRPDSFWSNSSLRGFHATQTPPPAYESVIRAFQETCT
ncbi:LOW QUALITY PROTEIN: myc target protein 1 homolog [Anguilla rostrata]|uniref:LOW QUALITY PROTEIN: myc target protein 1 homolog n=1 Tax=Anguilla rostrata TaxID=7938 RepID=UPI0030CF03B9